MKKTDIGLLGVCAGFFTIHAIAVGLLNSKLTNGHGKANSLDVLFYYSGGRLGITGAGFYFEKFGWNGVLNFAGCFLLIPVITGFFEKNTIHKHPVRRCPDQRKNDK